MRGPYRGTVGGCQISTTEVLAAFGRSTAGGREKGHGAKRNAEQTRSGCDTCTGCTWCRSGTHDQLCSRLSKLSRVLGPPFDYPAAQIERSFGQKRESRAQGLLSHPNAQKVPGRATSAGRLSNEAPAACTALRGPKGEREESAEALSAEARERKKASPSRMYTR